MNRRTMSTALGAAALALGVVACSSDSTAPDQVSLTDAQIMADVAADAGDAVVSTLNTYADNEAADGMPLSASMGFPVQGISENCTGPDGLGWYNCSATTERGLSVTRSFRYWNGDSVSPTWSFANTDSVNHIVGATGSYTGVANSAKTYYVNRNDTATVAITHGSPRFRTWNGFGTRGDSSQYTNPNGVLRRFHYTALDTAVAVKIQEPRSSNPFPISGTITHNVTTLFTADKGDRHFSRTITREVVVTFNGTANVTIQIGGLTCQLDLSTRVVSGCQ